MKKLTENFKMDRDEKSDLYGLYSDIYKEKNGIRPRWVSPKDLSIEDLKLMIDELEKEPSYEELWPDYADNDEDNQEFYKDLDKKNSSDDEISTMVNLGPEQGDEFHSFAGMGKGRLGRNKIHETETDEVAPPGGEKLVKALKKNKDIDNPWAVAWSKYNKGELKENNKITIGELRKLIKEELLKIK